MVSAGPRTPAAFRAKNQVVQLSVTFATVLAATGIAVFVRPQTGTVSLLASAALILKKHKLF